MTERGGFGGLPRLWKDSEKFRFLVVGAYNTAVGYLIFIGLYLLLAEALHYILIALLSHILAVTNAFIGHKYLVFRARGELLADFLRFNMTYLGTLLFGLAALPVMVEVFAFHPIAAQGLLVVVTVLTSYVLHKKVSFRRRP